MRQWHSAGRTGTILGGNNMMKRWLCLFLCALMLLSAVLTGCSSKKETGEEDKDKISEDASASAMTLSMWIVSEEEVTAEVANAVTRALNEITESKFKTRLAIH